MESFKGGAKKRIIGLDVLRIFLAVLIYLFHSHMHFKCDYFLFNPFISMGAIAMTGFFMLSGYILHQTYINSNLTQIQEIKNFYLKRFITVLPLYYFVAIIYSLYGTAEDIVTMKENVLLFPVELLCLQTTFSSLFAFTHNGGTWFISCIMMCYILFPFILNISQQLSNRSKIILAFFICVILLYAPIVQYAFGVSMIYENPFYRSIEFTVGVLLSSLICYTPNDSKIIKKLQNKGTAFFVLIVLVSGVTFARVLGIPDVTYMLYNWIALPCFAALIVSLTSESCSVDVKKNKIIVYLSNISFAFFCCQILPVWVLSGKTCEIMGNDSNFFRIAISFAYCLVGSIIIHELIEKPCSKYLRFKFLK